MPAHGIVTDVLLIGAEELENLGTRYLAAVLGQHGFSVELASFSTAVEQDAVLWHAWLARPRVIGLSVIFQYRAPEFLELAARLRELFPEAHITAGGHFPTFAAEELLRDYPALDTIVRGEGELTLLELVERVDTPEEWHTILGLSYRDRMDGRVVHNPARPLIADLDRLPFPVRDPHPQQYLGHGYAPILGSRGCPHRCAFCSIQPFYRSSPGKPQRFRSVRAVVDEMEELHHERGVRFFVFNDDEWFPPGRARYGRVAAFRRELEARHVRPIISIKCRADDVERDLFRMAQEMGVVRAYVGIESGSDRSLKSMEKDTTVAQNRQALEILHELGMLADFGLIIFDPYSTLEDIRANLAFLREMAGSGLAPLSFGRMEVYAGTPILERLRREGRLAGSYLAWNYTIPDARVELLWRLIITTMWQRHYENSGVGKQASMACYELLIYRYLHAPRFDPSHVEELRRLVAALNRHSLDICDEMLDFVVRTDIRDARAVNAHAQEWAEVVNSADIGFQTSLEEWRAKVARRVWAQSALPVSD